MEAHTPEDSDTTGAGDDPESLFTPAPGTDEVLVRLLNLWEAVGVSQDVTLTVGAFVVSGTPFPLARWYERQGAIMEDVALSSARQRTDPVQRGDLEAWGAAIRDIYNSAADRVRRPKKPDGEGEALAAWEADIDQIAMASRQHITLKNVSILLPNGTQSDLPFWRGRLEHVSGWCLGRWQQRPYEGQDPETSP